MSTGGQFSKFDFEGRCNNIAQGPEGDVWFTEREGFLPGQRSYIGKASPGGHLDFVQLPKTGEEPNGLAMGPEGDLWITERGGYDTVKVRPIGPAKVLRMSPKGQFTEYPLPTPASDPGAMTVGPDGDLWYVDYEGKIGRIAPSGEINEFSLPRQDIPLSGLTAGPDGNIWFAGGENVGLITPDGAVTQYPEEVDATGIAAGSDGNIWITEPKAGKIGRIIPGAIAAGVEGSSAAVRRGLVRLTLLCGGGTPGQRCRGKVSLRLKAPKGATSKGRPVKRLVAGGKYIAASGVPKVVSLRPTAQGRKVLKRRGTFTVASTVSVEGGSGSTKPLTVKSK